MKVPLVSTKAARNSMRAPDVGQQRKEMHRKETWENLGNKLLVSLHFTLGQPQLSLVLY